MNQAIQARQHPPDWSSLPIFPLGTVLFPGGALPLKGFEARYIDMTRECMKSGMPFGICLIKEGAEVGSPAVPHTIGCLATITDWDMQQLGVLQTNLSAANSQITDVDVAQESTNYAKYQILVQSGTSMLAQANQNPQSVLKLLQ